MNARLTATAARIPRTWFRLQPTSDSSRFIGLHVLFFEIRFDSLLADQRLSMQEVASPINPARGTIASADARNTRIGLAPNQFRATPIGMNTSSQFRLTGFLR
jgi:hypothetical protein